MNDTMWFPRLDGSEQRFISRSTTDQRPATNDRQLSLRGAHFTTKQAALRIQDSALLKLNHSMILSLRGAHFATKQSALRIQDTFKGA
jgi:hypothetical protein